MPSERDKARRWWQFDIRDMLLGMLVAGLSLGWWLDHRRLIGNAQLRRVELRVADDEVASLRGVLNAVQHELLEKHGIELVFGTRGNGGYMFSVRTVRDGGNEIEKP